MSYQEFVTELRNQYGCQHEEELSAKRRKHFSFAKNTNWRGKKFIRLIEQLAPIEWKNVRILDVGCAYGGFCIEAAKLGAETLGIDIVPRNHELAQVNARGEAGNPRFELLDATQRELRNRIAPRSFDLIILHDVLEHIYDTANLLENLEYAAADDCAVYFMVPNGKALQFVEKEGHRGIPGISLLPPPIWSLLLGSSFSIYYRPWRYFAGLFREYGFHRLRTVNSPGTVQGAELLEECDRIGESIKEYARLSTTPEEFRLAVTNAFNVFRDELRDDVESQPETELYWKYKVEFWEGFACRGKSPFGSENK